MTERPLGIADLLLRRVTVAKPTEPFPDHWYWCRQHEQAHKVGEKCNCSCKMSPQSGPHIRTCPQHPSNRDCIDIGPFMSEREAMRLYKTNEPGRISDPLGMEVES